MWTRLSSRPGQAILAETKDLKQSPRKHRGEEREENIALLGGVPAPDARLSPQRKPHQQAALGEGCAGPNGLGPQAHAASPPSSPMRAQLSQHILRERRGDGGWGRRLLLLHRLFVFLGALLLVALGLWVVQGIRAGPNRRHLYLPGAQAGYDPYRAGALNSVVFNVAPHEEAVGGGSMTYYTRPEVLQGMGGAVTGAAAAAVHVHPQEPGQQRRGDRYEAPQQDDASEDEDALPPLRTLPGAAAVRKAPPAHAAYARAITLGLASGQRSGEIIYSQRADVALKRGTGKAGMEVSEGTEGVSGGTPQDPDAALWETLDGGAGGDTLEDAVQAEAAGQGVTMTEGFGPGEETLARAAGAEGVAEDADMDVMGEPVPVVQSSALGAEDLLLDDGAGGVVAGGEGISADKPAGGEGLELFDTGIAPIEDQTLGVGHPEQPTTGGAGRAAQRPRPGAVSGVGFKDARERLEQFMERVDGLGAQAGFTGGIMGGVDPTQGGTAAGDLRTPVPVGRPRPGSSSGATA